MIRRVKMSFEEKEVERIVYKFADMVLRVAFQNTHNRQEAEDIMQDVFLAMMKKGEFKDDEHLKAWLIRVAINKSRDYLRAKRSSNLSFNEKSFAFSSDDKKLISEIDALAQKDKYAIYLHYYEGYSCKEIAKVLRTSEKSIFTRLSRAREKLKDILEKEDKS